MLQCEVKQPGRFKKNRILRKAWAAGCDFDGDCYVYHGTFYFVMVDHVSKTVRQPLKGAGYPFFYRWFINGNFAEIYIMHQQKRRKHAIK